MRKNWGMFFGLQRLGTGGGSLVVSKPLAAQKSFVAGVRRWAVVLGLAGATFGGISVVQAGIITPPASPYSFTPGPTPYSQTINVDQINLAPGQQLISITLTLTVTMSGSGSVVNTTLKALKVFADTKQTGDVTASLSDTTVLDEAFPTVHPIGSDTTISANSELDFNGVNGTATVTDTYTTSGLIDQFVGNGQINVNIAGDSSTLFDGQTGLTFSSSDVIYGTFAISYDVVPEPSTWISGALLLGVAGVGAGCSLWRKRNQAAA